jgi:hypothetical protein
MTNNMTLTTTGMNNATLDSLNKGVKSLQTSLIINEVTATNFMNAMMSNIHKRNFSFPITIEMLGNLLANNMPKLVDYYLHLIQNGERLQKPWEKVQLSETVLYVPYGYSFLSPDHPESNCEISFDASFADFYNEVIARIIQEKLEFIILGLQDIYEQVGVSDFQGAYVLLQTTNEAAVQLLTRFAWSTKARRLSDVLHGKPFPETVNPQFKDIPAAVQIALAFPKDESDHLEKANQALTSIMAMDLETRQKLLQNLRSNQIAVLPRLAAIIRDAAIYMKQTPWAETSLNSMRLALLYGPTIPAMGSDLIWARDMLSKSFSNDLSNLFIPDAFLNRIINQLPAMRCLDQVGCFEVMQQPANLLQQHHGLQALEQNTTLPPINFAMSLPDNSVFTQLSTCTRNHLPELAVSVALLSGAAYCGYSIYRQFNFFTRRLGIVRRKEETSPSSAEVTATATYRPTGSTQSMVRRFFGGSSVRDQQVGYTPLQSDSSAQFKV